MPYTIRSDSDPLPPGSLGAGNPIRELTELDNDNQQAKDYTELRRKAQQQGGSRHLDILDQNNREAGWADVASPAKSPAKSAPAEPEYTVIDGKTLGLDYPLEFPKSWSKSRIRAAISKEYPDLKPDMLRLAIPDPKRTYGEEVTRAAGLTARSALSNNPASSLAIIGGNLLSGTVNDLKRVWNLAAGQPKESKLPYQESTGDYAQRLLSGIGLPEPESDKERVISGVQGGLIGGATGQMAAARLPGPVAARMAEGPIQQPIAGAVGGAAAATAANAGYGPLVQAGANMAGGAIATAPRVGMNAVKEAPFVGQNLPTPAERPDLQQPITRQGLAQANQRDFAQAGISKPSAGEITQAPAVQTYESAAAHSPASFDVMKKQGVTQQSELGAKVEAIVDQLVQNNPAAKDISPSKASSILNRGLNGETEGFRDRAGVAQDKLYAKSKATFSTGASGVPTNVRDVLNRLTAINPAEKNLTGGLVNSEVQTWRNQLEADLAGPTTPSTGSVGGVPLTLGPTVRAMNPTAAAPGAVAPTGRISYDTLFKLRQDIGEKLRQPSDTRNTGQLRQVYAALTKDMEMMALEADVAAGRTTGPAPGLLVTAHNAGQAVTDAMLKQAKQQGGPAMRSLDRANAFTRALWKREDEVLAAAKGPGQEIYDYAVNAKELESGNRIARIMNSLNPNNRVLNPRGAAGAPPPMTGPDLRDAVKAQFIRNMGIAKPGLQNVEGDVWSSQTFLTNYNKMGKVAKDVMFAGMDGDLRAQLDNLARVSLDIREGANVFKNPSGTGHVVAAVGTVSALGAAVLTGSLGTAGTLMAGLAVQRMTSHMMFNPTFVNWLSTSVRKPSGALPAQLNILAQQFANESPELRKEVQNYIGGVTANMHTVDAKKKEQPKHFFTIRSMPSEDND